MPSGRLNPSGRKDGQNPGLYDRDRDQLPTIHRKPAAAEGRKEAAKAAPTPKKW